VPTDNRIKLQNKTSKEGEEMKTNKKILSALMVAILALTVIPVFAAEGTININTAGTDELALLPRVGAVVAQRIVDFREANGEFQSIEELLLVEGIGERTFALMKPYVATGGETTLNEKVRIPRTESAGAGS